jgi:tetratricopeptide (TPR) repeat protein
MLDTNLFGRGPGGPHAVNLLLHVGNTLLLYLALRKLSGTHWRSAAVAALFAVHPLHVESVAWVAERKDVLSAFFFFLTLLSYGNYAEASSPSTGDGPPRTGRGSARMAYGLSLLWFCLGLMSKPMVVTLPFVLLLMDFWPLRRLGTEPRFETKPAQPFSPLIFWRRVIEKIPFFVLSLISCILTLVAQRGAIQSVRAIPIQMRIENSLVSYARYVLRMFWPVDLALPYPYPKEWSWVTIVASVGLIGGISLVGLILARRQRFFVTGWFWFLGMLVPVIGLDQVGSQAMADRYTYLPLVGLFIIVVWGFQELRVWLRLPRVAVAAVGIAVLAACSARTIDQLQYWRDSERLFVHSIAVTEGNAVACAVLGSYLADAGRTDEAIAAYRRALESGPVSPGDRNNLANLLARQKRYEEAVRYYREELEGSPGDAVTHGNLAASLMELGVTNEAFSHGFEAVRIAPGSPLARYRMGNLFSKVGKYSDAIEQYQAALQLKPDYANALNALGVSYLKVGRLDEAASQFNRALGYDSGSAAAHLNLADIYVTEGKWDSASNHYAAVLVSDPESSEAHFGLARSLAALGNRAGAVSNLQETLRLQPGHPGAKELLQGLSNSSK